jgi:MFS family permease
MSGLAIFFHTQQVSDSLAMSGYAVGTYAFISSLTAAPRGHIIDRYGMTLPLGILIPSYALSAAAMGLYGNTSTAIVICAALMGLSAPPINMTVRPLWKDLAGESLSRTAFALDSSILNTTGLVGPVIATWVSLHFDGTVAMFLVSSFMFVGGIAMLTSPLSRNWKPEAKVPGEKGLLRSPAMRILALEGVLIGLGWGIFDVTIPSAATIANKPGWAAPAMAAVALGGLVGSLYAGSRLKAVAPSRGLIVCQTLFALFALPLFLIPPGILTVIVVFFASLPGGVSQVFYIEVVDTVRPRGTAVSALGTLWFIEGSAAAAGNAAAGVLAETVGTTLSYIATSVCFALSVIVLRYGIKNVMHAELAAAHEQKSQLSN